MFEPATPSQPVDSRYFLRSGSGRPSLGLAQSFWALSERDTCLADALESACSEGYSYFEVGLSEERLSETKDLVSRMPLSLIAQGWASTADETDAYFERALTLGAIAINFHLGHAFMPVSESAELLSRVQEKADAFGLPLLIETHRGRFTQDLLRTQELLRRLPKTTITLDVSHYIVAGEGTGGSEKEFHRHIEPLLARTGLIHGRISNGQSVQVPVEDKFSFASGIQSLWARAMTLWLKDAPDGAVFIFEPELGPPPYAYLGRGGQETFSREEESRTLTRLARLAWNTALANRVREDSL